MVKKTAETEALPDDLLSSLEAGVRSVLTDKKATRAEKVQAITAGTKLLLIRHKIKGSTDDDNFFGGSG